ncbi:phosphate acetyltransferase [Schaalia odontolytica]|uniref:Phosphate acetyltransferase n=1 Tax=Schaalia odontolytica TaxID=1660 RepID=A0A2X0UEG4_9ACTO|nr:phosphate acetyltransferase [Schaalia odontolytica]WMS26895.1 phosphate acetyltransferase [Schaalia odontolytica]SPT55538.1 Phosphate acetyltransferase [Schaalia odontolytica]
MSRFIVVAPGSSEAAALATDELARVLGTTTADALAGTTVTDAALRPAVALPAAVEAVRAAGDDVLITPAREASNRSFDHVAWNLSLAASTRAGVILAFDAEGTSAELLTEEIAAARLRAEAAAASVIAIVLTGGAPAIEADVPVLPLPLAEDAAATLRATAAPTAVTPLAFQADLIERARADRKRIVLPEPDDDRVLQAAAQVLAAGIADITFVGDADYVAKRAGELGLDLSAAQVVSVNDPAYLERYAEEFARLRAKKGVTLEQARAKVTDVSYFGTMMVHMGDADGMVSGAAHTTAHTIVPSFQIIKTAPGVSVVSSIFLMAMKDRVWAFGDCAVNPNPTAEQLADIAVTSARTAAQFGVTPRVAMLSYSTGTSGAGPDVDVVVEATRLAREKDPELAIEGPIQFDAAVDEAVASKKLPGSQVAGKATVFIFPSLEAGNIGYKAVQRSSGAVAVGPVLQGLNKPVNDLSRGALVEDIVNTVALTAVQAQG